MLLLVLPILLQLPNTECYGRSVPSYISMEAFVDVLLLEADNRRILFRRPKRESQVLAQIVTRFVWISGVRSFIVSRIVSHFAAPTVKVIIS
jgi:hypothetical protein